MSEETTEQDAVVATISPDSIEAMKTGLAESVKESSKQAMTELLQESGILDPQGKPIHKEVDDTVVASPLSVVPFMEVKMHRDEKGFQRMVPKEEIDPEILKDFIIGVSFGPDRCRTEKVKHILSLVGQAQIKAMVGSSDAAGGYVIPTGFVAEMLHDEVEASELLPYVRVINVGVRAGSIPSVDSRSSITWSDTENNDTGESDPTLAEFTWTSHTARAYAYISNELVDESAVDIVAEVRRQFSEAMAEELDKVIAIGDGSTQPMGLFSNTDITTVTATAAFTRAKALAVAGAVGQKYKKGQGPNKPTRWVMREATKTFFKELEGTTNHPVYKTDPNSEQDIMPEGYPISIQNDAPAGRVVFGNLNRYILTRLKGVTIGADRGGIHFRKGVTCLQIVQRIDGNVERALAFRKNSGAFTAPS